MNIYRAYGLVFFFIFILQIAYCSIDFEHINSDDGLSNDNVICIIQDKEGILWFGTQDGINMYDGYDIKVFKPKPGSGINISMVRCMFIDDDGILWIGKRGSGIVWFNTKNKTFLPFEYISDFSIDDLRILDFAYNDSVVWIAATIDGQLSYNRNTKRLLLDTLSYPLAKTTSLLYDNGILWMGKNRNENEFVKYNVKTQEVVSIDFYRENEIDLETYIWDIKPGIDGNLLLASWGKGLIVYDPVSDTKQPQYTYITEKEGIYPRMKSVVVKNNQIWLAARKGLQQITWQNNKYIVETIPLYENGSTLGYNNTLQDLLLDHSGNLWIGSLTEGVKKIDFKKRKFQLYNSNNTFDKIGPNISFLYNVGENEFFSGFELKRFNLDTKEVSLVKYIGNLETDFRVLNMEHFEINGKSMVLLGTWLRGIIFIDGDKSLNRIDTAFRIDYLGFYIIDFLKDSKNNIWFGTEQGVKVLKYVGEPNQILRPTSFEIIDPKFNNDIFYDANVRCLEEDAKGNIWIGTLNGLARISGYYNLKQDTIPYIYYSQNSKGNKFLYATGVECIFQSQKDTLWFGTVGGGLAMYNYHDDTIVNFTEIDGLNGDNIFEIIEEKSGVLWLSTNRGISRFELHAPKTQQFINYTVDDGLQGSIFSNNAAYKNNRDEIFFGGTLGLNRFHPDSIPLDTIPPYIKIIDFTVYNHSYEEGKYSVHLDMLKKEEGLWNIKLSPKDYAMEIRFSALSYSSPMKNQYAFFLEGYDERWRNVSAKERVAYYSNLPAGEYVFKIKASNSLGYWSEEQAKIKVYVVQKIWKRSWFIITLFAFATFCYFLFYRLRVKVLKQRQKLLERKVEERTYEYEAANEELKATNEELFQKSEIISEQNEELEQILRNLKETQLKLIQAEKMASLGILTAGVAHEINNPLNFIKGGLIGLQDYFKKFGSQNQESTSLMLSSISSGIERTSAIVKGLNQFSRDNDQFDEDCNIQSILDNSLLVLQNIIKYKATVEKKYNCETCMIKGNVGKLHQAFVNILTNSIHAIENEGRIIVEITENSSGIIVTISDDGEGISPENLKHITDPFFTTKEPGKGTGLGLSLTYSIIKDHKGILEFESTVGKGTKVIVTFPLPEK